MPDTPIFNSGGFKRSQSNAVGVYLTDVDGNPYTSGGGAGSSTVDSHLQFEEGGAAWVDAPGTAARGLLVDPISGTTDGAVGLPARIGIVGGYDGTNARVLKTSAAGVVQVDVLTMPAGGATAANQATEITHLTSIRDRLPDNTATAAPAATDEGIVVHVATMPAGGGGSVAQYTEADIDASITGVAFMWEDASDTLRAVSAAKPLPISDAGGSLTVDGSVAVTGSVTADTELPAAAALADNTANPTVPGVAAFGMVWDGANWDREPATRVVSGTVTANAGTGPFPVSDNGGSLTVDAPVGTPVFTRLSDGAAALVGQKTMANSLPVAIASDQSAIGLAAGTNNIGDVDVLTLPALPAGTNNIGDVDVLTLPAISLAASTNNIGDVDVLTLPAIPAGTNNIGDVDIVGGLVAHDGADSGNPVKVGARAISADITAVAANDRIDALTSLLGKALVLPYALPSAEQKGTANSTGTGDTSVIAAPGAGLRLYITTLIITNAHATVGTKVQIKSGTTSTGYPRVYAAEAGGGASIHFPKPLRLAANEALQFACVTTGADVDVSAVGYVAGE